MGSDGVTMGAFLVMRRSQAVHAGSRERMNAMEAKRLLAVSMHLGVR